MFVFSKKVFGFISTKTGLAPTLLIASAVAKKLKDEVITSSPSPMSKALNARINASVPLLQPTAYFVPISDEKESSNCLITSPPIN